MLRIIKYILNFLPYAISAAIGYFAAEFSKPYVFPDKYKVCEQKK